MATSDILGFIVFTSFGVWQQRRKALSASINGFIELDVLYRLNRLVFAWLGCFGSSLSLASLFSPDMASKEFPRL
jgi:hypothetical protein